LLIICFVQILRVARELGDFLLVGIHNDQTVRFQPSFFFPSFFFSILKINVVVCA